MADVYEYKKIVKEGDKISASDVMATNMQSVQANLEQIDERIDALEPEEITNLDGYTWKANETINMTQSVAVIDFACDGIVYDSISFYSSSQIVTYRPGPGTFEVTVYQNGAWVDDKYREIQFIGRGTIIIGGGLITNLKNNGKLVKTPLTKQAVANVGGLVTPTQSPSVVEIVGIDSTGAQVRIQVDTNDFEIDGSTSPYTLKKKGE